MSRASQLTILKNVAVSSLVLASACGGEIPEEETSSEALTVESQPATRNHIMPMLHEGALRNFSAPTGALLKNYGGPVLKNVKVIPVYWSSKVAYQTNLNAFYAAVPNSPHFDLLAQYSGIGRGTRGTAYVDNKTTTKVTDAQIQAELNRLFTAGSLPLPNANNYYPVHFPSGVSVTDSSGTKSCVTFCAYHGTYVRSGVNVNYGVIPDQGGSCAGGCGSDPSAVNNLTSVSSHELVEATTDPGVGLATTYAPPLAWYDQTNGEIGDICNAKQGPVVGGDGKTYVVQAEFSNAKKDCIVQ